MSVEIGKIYDGKVAGITKFGAFVDVVVDDKKETGMVHISEVSQNFVEKIEDILSLGDEVKVKVLKINDDGKISMSIKKAIPRPKNDFQKPRPSFNNNKPKPAPKKSENNQQSASNEVFYSDGSYQKASGNQGFEDMLSKFKSTSEEKISDLKKVTDQRRGGKRRK